MTRLTESEIARSSDYVDRFPEAFTNLSKWTSEGRITRKFHVVEGLEKAPESLPLLFSGGNTGKLFVSQSSGRHNLSDSMCFSESFAFLVLMRTNGKIILAISFTTLAMAFRSDLFNWELFDAAQCIVKVR